MKGEAVHVRASGSRLRNRRRRHDPDDLGGTAIHCKRDVDCGSNREKLRSGGPVIGIVRSESDPASYKEGLS